MIWPLHRLRHWNRHWKVRVTNAVISLSAIALSGSVKLDRLNKWLYRKGYYLSFWAFGEEPEELEPEEIRRNYCRKRFAPLAGECLFDLARGSCLFCGRKVGEPHAAFEQEARPS